MIPWCLCGFVVATAAVLPIRESFRISHRSHVYLDEPNVLTLRRWSAKNRLCAAVPFGGAVAVAVLGVEELLVVDSFEKRDKRDDFAGFEKGAERTVETFHSVEMSRIGNC